MKPLAILLSVFILACISNKFLFQDYDLEFSARIALSAMLLFTAIGHFIFTKGMSMMIPRVVPFKKALVYCTGGIEIAAAIGIHIVAIRNLTAWLLIIFLILILPANINAANKKIDFQKGTFSGQGLTYLWFRIPLQIVFILWVYFSCIN